jgi:RNA polymerase sigma-70 factor (ECF subfamily)
MRKDDGLRQDLMAAWHRFLDLIQAERPLLHRYCVRLTGNVWDAEDLVQDTLLRGFGTLGKVDYDIDNPRAYLLRMATNAWIDALRRKETAAAYAPEAEVDTRTPETNREVRDAGSELMTRLSPQERAAVMLKDVYGFSLAEIAECLGTSTGAVKTALHRGRSSLRDPEAKPKPSANRPSDALLDEFVERFNAGDPKHLAALMLEQGTVELVGCGFASGPTGLNSEKNWFKGALGGHPEWPAAFQFESQRSARGEFEGEPLILRFRTRKGTESLEGFVRLEEVDGQVQRVREYSFCPDTVRLVGEALGLEVLTGLYRWPTPAPGKTYGEEAQ